MKLEKPIVYFDLETTGVDTEVSRIVEIACIKYNVDGTTEEKTIVVNPTVPIPLEASDVHGITDEMVADKPTFKQYAQAVRDWFYGCDLAGFNSNNFDVPLLSAEFERAGIEGINWNPNLVDVMQLYRNLFPNTLSDVYKRLTGKELEGAHGALVDIQGTKEVMDVLFPMISEQATTPKEVDEYLQGDKKRFDLSGKMYIDVDDVVKWNFSKNKDKAVLADLGFANWVLNQSFSKETKDKLKSLMIKNDNRER